MPDSDQLETPLPINPQELEAEPAQPARMAQAEIFISYRVSSDEGLAKELKRLIESCLEPPPAVFVASAGGIVASHIGFRGQISVAARTAQAFIGVITKDSINKEWIFFEAGAAWGRNVLYAPLVVNVNFADLPDTIADYHAIKATDVGSMRRLMNEIASRTQKKLKQAFSRRFSSFEKIARAWPDEPIDEEKDAEKELWHLLIDERYEEAQKHAANMIDGETDPKRRGRTRVILAFFDKRLDSRKQLDALDAIAPEEREHALFYSLRASIEPRDYVRVENYRKCLDLSPNSAQRREALCDIGRSLWQKGMLDEAFAAVHELLTSQDGYDRSTGAMALNGAMKGSIPAFKFSVLTIAIGGRPDESHFRAMCDVNLGDDWKALSLFVADRFERVIKSGVSANCYGIALARAGLPNIGYEAYQKASDRGVSVSKVNMAAMVGSQAVPFVALEIVSRHEGAFDSASPGYPYLTRSTMENAVDQERDKLESLLEIGKVQYVLWEEFIGKVLVASTRATRLPSKIRIDGHEYEIVLTETGDARCTSRTSQTEIIFGRDRYLPGIWVAEKEGILRLVGHASEDGWMGLKLTSKGETAAEFMAIESVSSVPAEPSRPMEDEVLVSIAQKLSPLSDAAD